MVSLIRHRIVHTQQFTTFNGVHRTHKAELKMCRLVLFIHHLLSITPSNLRPQLRKSQIYLYPPYVRLLTSFRSEDSDGEHVGEQR